MKIIILGAGDVGTTLAEHLAIEHNDVTIIDIDGEHLHTLQERMDIYTITGNGAYPNTLKRGGAEEADMLIAVTSSDEINLVACQVAASLFQIPSKIARIRSLQYLAHEKLFSPSAFPVDVLISPEQVITNYIHHLIEYPHALQVLDFADQKLQLVAVKAKTVHGTLVGHSLKSLQDHLATWDTEIVIIFRHGKPLPPNDTIIIESNDEVYFLASTVNMHSVMNAMLPLNTPNERIIIAGGGNIGTRLASCLEENFQVKIIEKDPDRIEALATHLSKGIVLQGDASDKELLLSENIENTDVFCAVCNQDETNIMSALLAKRLGARKTMALISRPSYLELVEGGDIDIVISPQQATIASLLIHVKPGHVANVHPLRHGETEAIEIIVSECKNASKIIGRHFKDIQIPNDANIVAMVRNGQMFTEHHDIAVEPGDRMIILLFDKRKIRQIERLFQEENSSFV